MRVGVDLIEIGRASARRSRGPASASGSSPRPSAPTATRAPNPAQHYAGRFAAKEAIGKALGCGVHFTWREIEIAGRPKPGVNLSGWTKAWGERSRRGLDRPLDDALEGAGRRDLRRGGRVSALEPLYTADEMRAAEEALRRADARAHGARRRRDGRARARALSRARRSSRSGAARARTAATGSWSRASCARPAARPRSCSSGRRRRSRATRPRCSRRRARRGVPFVVAAPSAPDVAVDAIFGTGFSGAPRREAAAHIGEIRLLGIPVVSVDVPSGVDASTGVVSRRRRRRRSHRHVPRAQARPRVGPGRYRCGEIVVADIGLAGGGERSNGRATKEILGKIPRRGLLDHKYSAGHVVVVGGSPGLTGAPFLTAEAAMRAGAGYVRAVVPESLAGAFAQRFVEVTLSAAPSTRTDCSARRRSRSSSPRPSRRTPSRSGRGWAAATRPVSSSGSLLDRVERPLVLDGDGLWAVTGHLEWVFTRDVPTVLTPHAGELGRLLGRESSWVDANRLSGGGRRGGRCRRGCSPQGRRLAGRGAGPRRARGRSRHTRSRERGNRRRAHRSRGGIPRQGDGGAARGGRSLGGVRARGPRRGDPARRDGAHRPRRDRLAFPGALSVMSERSVVTVDLGALRRTSACCAPPLRPPSSGRSSRPTPTGTARSTAPGRRWRKARRRSAS